MLCNRCGHQTSEYHLSDDCLREMQHDLQAAQARIEELEQRVREMEQLLNGQRALLATYRRLTQGRS